MNLWGKCFKSTEIYFTDCKLLLAVLSVYFVFIICYFTLSVIVSIRVLCVIYILY